ncbi:Z1 domain-containing protein [Streptomyces ipomoeae]|uniref:Z1 domain-containing protein n=1 Tax=Streptomyces ipomoeae TaxID=103232 RepID=UPI0029AEA467|nr:Z1 domain-containing protein [Streptomyces ipomoeae]MDX2824355.1 Z1 domain-containing protein [Streptomyces ipomoeae]MDX2877023.1 Z1 domain-containing protein [Streptomyces ipomoeae]
MTDAETVRLTLHKSALAGMQANRPKNLQRALEYQAEDEGPRAQAHATESDFQDKLHSSHSTDQLVELWRKQLTQWDYAENPAWSDTESRTDERRTAVFDLLGLQDETRKLLSALIPVPKAAGAVVISDEFTPWYTPQSQQGRSWYWPAYRRLLAEKGWPETAVADLDTASDRVVERLANPTDPAAYQSKGLVVGYVQSGKTANFTGVIAKAVDAGYRLIIVLGGTLNLLRAQTQRRLDMELVGRENILRGAAEYESDYADDPAWSKGKFLSHNGLPSALGAFDIVRMTTRDNDYKSLLQGIVALEFEKQEPALPLHDPRNLHRSSARLMVVKKNKTVLSKLVKDLNKIKTPLSEIPVLIIDDESDEASVNTSNLSKPDAERTAINQKISELLQMLPRAQYVGYTATPFANVFIDPSDTEDIFPKDFIVSLPRPDGYMGVQDFHDLDSVIPHEERTFANSNEKAHVRDIVLADDEDDTALQRAMDMFVLTAAMKLYREENGLGDRYFQHHTMLIHESVRTADHRELLGRVTQLWWNSGYASATGHERLRELFETDLAPVSHVRAEGQAVPDSYAELARYIGAAAMRIGGDDQPIIVVNGDKDIETGEADFDKRSIWKILIGGQKLARGFTVEGLTVTYYRRRTNNASTLMQMGRWFGFRKGYRDLVRLYLGREETMGAKDIDLYEAFEAICRDEETFRRELQQYAEVIDGQPQVTPAQVPPLVSQHLSWLPPTSANKMFNAQLVEKRSPGQWEEPTAYPVSAPAIRHNTGLWMPVLESLTTTATEFAYHFGAVTHRFSALTGLVTSNDLLPLLRSLKWGAEAQFAPHLRYLEEITKSSPAKVEDWLVLAPQHASGNKHVLLGTANRPFSWFSRTRRRGPLFGAVRDPKHVAVALRIAGALPSSDDPATEHYVSARRGVIVLYPIVEPQHKGELEASGQIDPSKLVMAFGFVAPSSARSSDGRVVTFTTIDSSDAAIITKGSE